MKTITQEQYDQAVAQKKAAEETIATFFKEKDETFQDRLHHHMPFLDEELIYSANTLCDCGHGMAYPKDCGPGHYWRCSALLKQCAEGAAGHTADLPFAFYEVKSEQQTSAYGRTTRGVFRPNPKTAVA